MEHGADYLRNLKDSMWWEGIKDISSTKREPGETKHRRRGPITAWETPLVVSMGLDWRSKRDERETN